MSRVRRELARNRRVTYRPRIGNEKSTCVNRCRNPWIRSESEIRSAVAVISGTSAIQTAIHINVAYDVLPTVPSVLFYVVESTLDLLLSRQRPRVRVPSSPSFTKQLGLFPLKLTTARKGGGELAYPLPWASRPDTNFVTALDTYRDALQSADFQIQRERSSRSFGIEFTEQVIARAAQKTQPALGLQLLMGDLAPVMMKNILAMMKQGLLEPVEVLSHTV